MTFMSRTVLFGAGVLLSCLTAPRPAAAQETQLEEVGSPPRSASRTFRMSGRRNRRQRRYLRQGECLRICRCGEVAPSLTVTPVTSCQQLDCHPRIGTFPSIAAEPVSSLSWTMWL